MMLTFMVRLVRIFLSMIGMQVGLTKGDYFVINCQNLGCNTGFHNFELVDTGSNTVLGTLKLPIIEN